MREYGEPGTGTHPIWVDAQAFHLDLARLNARRTRPGRPSSAWLGELERDLRAQVRELEFLESERQAVVEWASEAPSEPDRFAAWLAALTECGPGAGDPLLPFVAERASVQQVRQVVQQELLAEAQLVDLLPSAGLGLSLRPRLELARLLTEELEPERRSERAALVEALALSERNDVAVWEALARANLARGLAANRAYAHHALGALGARLAVHPHHAGRLAAGLSRLGLPAPVLAHLHRRAAQAERLARFHREVLTPLLTADPALSQPLAEGALMRMQALARCLERYRADLGLEGGQAAPTVH